MSCNATLGMQLRDDRNGIRWLYLVLLYRVSVYFLTLTLVKEKRCKKETAV